MRYLCCGTQALWRRRSLGKRCRLSSSFAFRVTLFWAAMAGRHKGPPDHTAFSEGQHAGLVPIFDRESFILPFNFNVKTKKRAHIGHE